MVAKTKKDKQIENIKKDTEIKNIKQSATKINIFLYFGLIILIIFFAIFYLIFQIDSVGIFKKEQPQTVEKIIDNNLRLELNALKNKVQLLEEQTANNINETDVLKRRIEDNELEISQRQIDTQRIELIKLALNIQQSIELGENYINILRTFKILMAHNNNLEYELNILFKYQNTFVSKQIIENHFNEEMDKFVKENNILNDDDNNFSSFMSKFVVIRKINNAKENSADNFINQLEENIKMSNYEKALNIIESNKEYSKYFSRTSSNIKINILINNTIQDIINYLINHD